MKRKKPKLPPPGEPGSEENPIDLRQWTGPLRLCCSDCGDKVRDTYLGDFEIKKTREPTDEERKNRVMPTLEIKGKRKCCVCHGTRLFIKTVTVTCEIKV